MEAQRAQSSDRPRRLLRSTAPWDYSGMGASPASPRDVCNRPFEPCYHIGHFYWRQNLDRQCNLFERAGQRVGSCFPSCLPFSGCVIASDSLLPPFQISLNQLGSHTRAAPCHARTDRSWQLYMEGPGLVNIIVVKTGKASVCQLAIKFS